jgi:hypothetical protein
MRRIFWLENLKGRDHSKKTRHRWEENIRIYVKEVGKENVEWIYLVQNRYRCWVVNSLRVT